MTTKKQRRAAVAAKREARIAAEQKIGLEAQRISREKRERLAFDAERAERSKKTANFLGKQRVFSKDLLHG